MGSKNTTNRFRIATVATFDYFPFLLVFLGSLYKHVNTNRISTIEILVDVLPDDLRKYLESYEKVRLHFTNRHHEFSGAHSEGWRSAVSEKLIFTKQLLEDSKEPLLLIDSDVMFTRDLDIFDQNVNSVIVTLINSENERHIRRDGLKIFFIGAAVFFQKAALGLEFIDRWMSAMRGLEARGYRTPHETPALNLLVEEYISMGREDIGFMLDDVIAADQKIRDGTVCVHLKSWGPTSNNSRENFMLRVSRVAWRAEHNPVGFLDCLAFERWLLRQVYPTEFDGTPPEKEAHLI